MKLPTRPNSGNGLTSQEKTEERETWLRLVVKVILWEDAPDSRNSTESEYRITRSEWSKYCKRIIKTNLTDRKEKVLAGLEDTLKKIKLHGGLEE